MTFVLYAHIAIPSLPKHEVTFFNMVYNLKEHETIFLEGQNVIFFGSLKYLIRFLF